MKHTVMKASSKVNPLCHMLCLEHCTIFYKHINSTFQIFSKKYFCYISIVLQILWKKRAFAPQEQMFNFYNILENLTFQRPPKVRVNYEFQ